MGNAGVALVPPCPLPDLPSGGLLPEIHMGAGRMKRFEGCVYIARSVGELDEQVRSLSAEGYQMMGLLKNDIGDYVSVWQREKW